MKGSENFMIINRKFFLAVMVLVLTLVPVCSYSEEFSDDDVIVVFRNSDSESASDFSASITASTNSYTKKIFPALSQNGDTYAVLRSNTRKPDELAKELLSNPNVVAASPNYKIYASAINPNDTYINNCWGLSYVNAPQAWEKSTGSDSVYVVIIDSGIDYTNPDLVDNIDTTHSKNVISGSTSSSATDDYGHGTHVAGIIGAKGNNSKGVAGVNWNVKLISIKVLNSEGSGTIADLITGLDYITGLIKNDGLNIRAVNMSFETYVKMTPTASNLISFPLWRAFKKLDDLNKTVLVVAAGNYGETVGEPSTYSHDGMVPSAGCYVYPASFNGINNLISVGALNSNGNLASFSNKGATLNAPGVKILSTYLTSNSNSYSQNDGVSLKEMQGTSMAAPFVSGAAALVASIAPSSFTAYQIKKTLMQDTTTASGLNSSVATTLDLNAVLTFQQTYSQDQTVLPSNAPASSEYDNWESTSTNTNTNTNTGGNESNSSSSGGCNGFMAGLMPVMLLVFVVKSKSYN